MRISKKILTAAETLAFLAGGFIFYQLLRAAGFTALKAAWDAAGLKLAGIFALYPLMTIWDASAWRNLFAAPRPRFFPLFWIRMAGEAVNNVTPGVDIGGEPLKIKWVSERLGVPASEATSATILGKTSMLVSETLFLWIGIFLGWNALPWPDGVFPALTLVAAVITGVVASLFLFQRTKLFADWSPATRDFYTRRMPQFAVSVLLNLGGWVSGAVELWAFSWILGATLSWEQALLLESLVQLVRTASFFIPGNIGTQEAGYVFLVRLMGFDPAFGMALSLLKRARQLAWTAAGFGIWGLFQCNRAAAQPKEGPTPLLDTPLDRLLHRPPAREIARFLQTTPVTPNAVTLASLVPAFAGSAALCTGTVTGFVAGFFGFFAWAVLDHADGELARLKNSATAFGRALDDACDTIASTALLVGLWFGLSHYWNARDHQILDRLFYPALALNTFAAFLALALKRDTAAASRHRRWLDAFTGREPFYFCLVLGAAAAATGHPWLYAFLGAFLIAGQAVLFFLSASAFVRAAQT